ncbi:MAG: DUF4004 family protein [Clostridiales bacterium]|nr:DUF4004 family protein [Clostridiales bacterium]
MYISKKDLLAITGISYGQLYRWKRERLIPEEWFIKQSSYTGQETFFPREQMLSRIRSILELKDKYSLEELARMLSPEIANGSYHPSDLEGMNEIDPLIISIFREIANKEEYGYSDIVLMIIVSEIKAQLKLTKEESKTILASTLLGVSNASTMELTIGVLKLNEHYLAYVVSANAYLYLDHMTNIVYKRNYVDVSNQIKIKYQKKFR